MKNEFYVISNNVFIGNNKKIFFINMYLFFITKVNCKKNVKIVLSKNQDF